MPKVTLIDFTGKGHKDPLYAAKLLAFTKNTRLSFTPGAFDAFMEKTPEEIAIAMEYMATTIPSSWEFCHVTFLVEEISRATAQQITRTRTASFAMASQRVTDMSSVKWDSKDGKVVLNGTNIEATFDDCMRGQVENYSDLVKGGMPLEDARELLPIGVHCQLVSSYNLRGLVELCRARDSLRVQGPYREVCAQMKAATIAVWPWSETFFTPPNAKAIEMIEDVAKQLAALQGESGAMYKGLSGTLAKAADLIKKG
jgi:flavin-dependent thymidylate synthase